jgi:hypothetical protein
MDKHFSLLGLFVSNEYVKCCEYTYSQPFIFFLTYEWDQ